MTATGSAPLRSERYLSNEFFDVLHKLRGDELKRLPPGAETVLSGGCDGAWYFRWFDEGYPTRPKRHIGVELYAPKPDNLSPSVEWLSRSLHDLSPVVDGEVDLVFGGQVIEHLWPDEITAFLCEAHRVLKPGGWLALDSPNSHVTSALRWIQPEHTVEFSVDEISQLLRLAGFVDISIRGVWLCYDRARHRFLPVETLDESDEWPRARRAMEAEKQPEDSFIWWAEAKRGHDAPKRAQLGQRIHDIAHRFRRDRIDYGFRHQIGTIKNGPGPQRVIASPGETGFLMFGPYVPLPAGRWRATYKIGASTPDGQVLEASEPVATIDVSIGNDVTKVAERALTVDDVRLGGALHDVVLPFELDETTFGVQFRLYTTGRVGIFARSDVEVEEDLDDSAEAEAYAPRTETADAQEPEQALPSAAVIVPRGASPALAEQRDEGGRRVRARTPATLSSSVAPRAHESASLATRAARVLLWPFLRFFDPRFHGLAQQLDFKHESLAWRVDRAREEAARSRAAISDLRGDLLSGVRDEVSGLRDQSSAARTETRSALDELRTLLHIEITNAAEATTLMGTSLADLTSLAEGGRTDLARLRQFTARRQKADERTARQIQQIREETHGITGSVEALRSTSDAIQAVLAELATLARQTHEEASKASGAYLHRLTGGAVSEFDDRLAPLLERENTPDGLAARHGLWFNPPVYVGYDADVPVVRQVNERVAEVAYAFGAIAALEAGATILDVGAAESLTAFSLASLGYRVTAVDPRGYPLLHPLLQSAASPIQDWPSEQRFSAVLCISTIEHIGKPAYGQPPANGREDLAAMVRIRELTDPGGLLVLTVPYGRPNEAPFSRTYDQAGLDELLEGWQVEDFRLLRRDDAMTWQVVAAATDEADDEVVALVTARRPE